MDYEYDCISEFSETSFVKVFYILLQSSICLLYFDTLIPLNAEAQFFPVTLFAVNNRYKDVFRTCLIWDSLQI